MTPETIVTIGEKAIEVTILLIAVLLVPPLIVGLLVSVFQAATQINEATLSFIPKMLTTLAVLIIGGPFILRILIDYTVALFESLPSVIG